MIRIGLIISILLSGCTSYSSLQKKDPFMQLNSTKLPSLYVGCIAPKLMDIWEGSVSIIPDNQKTIVVSKVLQTITTTLTISPSANGSHIELREISRLGVGKPYERSRAVIQSCI